MAPSEPPDAPPVAPVMDGDPPDRVDGGRSALENFRMIYRWRRLGAAVWVIAFLAAIVYAYTATPLYHATATLLIEVDGPNVVNFRQVIEERRGGSRVANYYQTQYNMLASRSLAQRTIERLGWWEHPDFTAAERFSWLGAFGVTNDGVVAVEAAEDDGGPAASIEAAHRSRVINRFLDRLDVRPVRNSRIVDVTFRSAHPEVAASAANALAREHIERNLEFRFQSSLEAADWLGQRLAEQRRLVADSELALQRYREEHETVALDNRRDVVVQELVDFNAAVTRATTERIEAESRYRQLVRMQDVAAPLDTFPAILRNSFIQVQRSRITDLRRREAELAETLGDRHPDLIEIRRSIEVAESELRIEVGKVVESVRNEFLAAEAHEQSLRSELERQRNSALALNRAESSTACWCARPRATGRSMKRCCSARTRRASRPSCAPATSVWSTRRKCPLIRPARVVD